MIFLRGRGNADTPGLRCQAVNLSFVRGRPGRGGPRGTVARVFQFDLGQDRPNVASGCVPHVVGWTVGITAGASANARHIWDTGRAVNVHNFSTGTARSRGHQTVSRDLASI